MKDRPAKITDITLQGDPLLFEILHEYCENCSIIPTEEAKTLFVEWIGRVPAKLIRQAIFAGIYWSVAHKDEVVFEWSV